jgi:phospholipid-binding lipoprotein MlaA
MIRLIHRLGAALAVLLVAGCATVGPASKDDPLEPWNRAMYEVHQVVDGKIVKPAVQAYVDVTPRPIQSGIRNFFGNLDDVVSVMNDFLQWKLDKAGNDMGRVMINSAFGFGGLIDIASSGDIPRGMEDFGQTFGYWGIPQGPFLFVPLWGPTTVRDGTGELLRLVWSPTNEIPNVALRNTVYGVIAVNLRANALDATSLLEQASIDPYTFVRRSYLQRREYLVYDGNPPPPKDDD